MGRHYFEGVEVDLGTRAITLPGAAAAYIARRAEEYQVDSRWPVGFDAGPAEKNGAPCETAPQFRNGLAGRLRPPDRQYRMPTVTP